METSKTKKISLYLLLIVFVFSSKAQVQLKKTDYFDFIGAFSAGFAVVINNDKYGFINARQQLIIPCMYEGYEAFDGGDCITNNAAVVKLNGKWGVVDTLNHIIVNFEYDWINPFGTNGLSMASKKKKLVLINSKG